MFLKFLKTEKTFDFTSLEFVGSDKVKIIGSNATETKGGFDVIDGDIIDHLYNQYTVPYDKADDYIVFTSDERVYFTWFVYDAETKYVTSQVTNNESSMENAVLRQSGQGKKYAEPEQEVLFDADGFNIYKVSNGNVIKTTAEDKKPYMDEKALEEYEAALDAKLNEISTACKAAIVNGVDFGNSHYSYDAEDQNNISNATTLAIQTGLAVPYHADGESCRLFEKDEIVGIYVAEETNLTHNTTYHNQLKLYTMTLPTKAEIEAIEYGVTELTGQYLETYNMIMAQAEEVIRHFIGEN